MKDRVKATPLLGPALVAVNRRLPHRFAGSRAYWENRYAAGGTSGAGSYGEFAAFKAEVLNKFVAENGLRSIIEFGCGDGAQLALAEYPRYLGFDVSRTAIRLCLERFRSDDTKSFLWFDPSAFVNRGSITAEAAISLDVIEHLVEDEALDAYLHNMAAAATRFLIFFTEDQKPQPANSPHVRYRDVSGWAPMLTDWSLVQTIDNPLKGPFTQADFFIFAKR